MIMKKVLIINSQQLFRDFLKNKLTQDQIEVTVSQHNRDGYTKIISTLPNLIIMDMDPANQTDIELLEKKGSDVNAASIPIIITGPEAERSYIASLAKYGVIKYFAKPIQFDVLFDSISKVLKIPLSMDLTPSVLDIHHNGNIIFVEFAQGLNQEKLSLLQYKLTDLITKENLESPKVIIMFTALDLTFVDGCNIEFLIENILACPKVHTKNVKILSTNRFIFDLIEGHKAYAGIEVSDNLPRILNSLVDTTYTSSVSDLITDRIITSSAFSDEEITSIDNTFYSDNNTDAIDSSKSGTVLHVAIIDSNAQSLLLTKTVFETVGASCFTYNTSQSFLSEYERGKFDLIILDVFIEDGQGIQILQSLQREHDVPPIAVYSQSLQKDTIVKALSSGASSYIIKPQKPNVLLQKCLSLLRGNS